MTYAVGRAITVRVSDEIRKERPAPNLCHYNVLEGSFSEEMAQFCASVTHIYNLASPAIARSESNR